SRLNALLLSQGPEESARFVSSISISRAVPAGAVLGACALTHTSLCDSIALLACKCADRRETAYVSANLNMIQSARNAEEQNLEAYMKNRHLVFRAIKDIPENTELLVWYGRDLAKLLGLSTEQKNTKGLICSECKQCFLFEFPLLAHKRFFCIKKPTSFLKKITIPEIHSSKPATNFHNLARELENCRKNRPTDAKSPKRRRSLESDTDESDGEPSSFDTHGDEKVLVKRFCVKGVNRCSWASSSEKSSSKGQNSPWNVERHHFLSIKVSI
uniref:Si:dkeyp-41f9.4 n=1 Tax=Sinocyclocheilus anshuiensis TaxID=1608454 RepID=A0A671T393_9TELE